jgi:hypothetical protein
MDELDGHDPDNDTSSIDSSDGDDDMRSFLTSSDEEEMSDPDDEYEEPTNEQSTPFRYDLRNSGTTAKDQANKDSPRTDYQSPRLTDSKGFTDGNDEEELPQARYAPPRREALLTPSSSVPRSSVGRSTVHDARQEEIGPQLHNTPSRIVTLSTAAANAKRQRSEHPSGGVNKRRRNAANMTRNSDEPIEIKDEDEPTSIKEENSIRPAVTTNHTQAGPDKIQEQRLRLQLRRLDVEKKHELEKLKIEEQLILMGKSIE